MRRLVCGVFPALVAGLAMAGVALAGDRITPIDAPGFRADLAAREGKVVLVNFWATWCRPCLEEIPALMELERQLGEQGFELVAVSLDDPVGSEALLEPFLDKWFPDFTTFLSMENDMDAMVSVIDPYWNEVLPTSYVVGRDGSMAERIQGGSTAQEFSAIIRRLLDREAAEDALDSGPM